MMTDPELVDWLRDLPSTLGVYETSSVGVTARIIADRLVQLQSERDEAMLRFLTAQDGLKAERDAARADLLAIKRMIAGPEVTREDAASMSVGACVGAVKGLRDQGDAARAEAERLREALEKIADEQKVLLRDGAFDILPALEADEAQTVARAALAEGRDDKL